MTPGQELYVKKHEGAWQPCQGQVDEGIHDFSVAEATGLI